MKDKTILLIDADGDCEEVVAQATERGGYRVRSVRTGREAFELLARELRQLDLILVDVDPGAHGMALLEAISGCAERPPMIVLTALEEDYMKPIASEHGAADCLGKPLILKKLATSIARVIAEARLTSDQWGHPTPSRSAGRSKVKAALRGIAGKLSPTVSKPATRSKKSKKTRRPLT